MKQNISKLFVAVMLLVTSMVACNKKLEVLDANNPTIDSYFLNSNRAAEWRKCYLF